MLFCYRGRSQGGAILPRRGEKWWIFVLKTMNFVLKPMDFRTRIRCGTRTPFTAASTCNARWADQSDLSIARHVHHSESKMCWSRTSSLWLTTLATRSSARPIYHLWFMIYYLLFMISNDDLMLTKWWFLWYKGARPLSRTSAGTWHRQEWIPNVIWWDVLKNDGFLC